MCYKDKERGEDRKLTRNATTDDDYIRASVGTTPSQTYEKKYTRTKYEILAEMASNNSHPPER